jgi:hypothetical protein
MGAELRVRRAGLHIEGLYGQLQEWADAHVEVFQLQPTPAGFKPVQAEPLPVEVLGEASVFIGDVLSNLRAALDYFVYVFAWVGNDFVPVRDTQFPIETSMDNFTGRITGKHPKTEKPMRQFLRCVPAQVVQRIRELQPCWDPPCEWTGYLRALSNPDKHQHLSTLSGSSRMNIHGTEPFGPGAMKIKGEIEVELRFTATGTDVLETLRLIHARVQALVDEFKPTIQRTDAV